MKKLASLFVMLLLLVFNQDSNAKNIKRVLFIGNSYTYVNNLPQLVASINYSSNDSIYYDSNTPGGYTFYLHSTDATTLAKIALGNWDYVVLQAQSQEPSFSPAQVANDVLPYAHKLDSLIHLASPCAETVFYMTWGRKNGDAANCTNYPPVCTYTGMQDRLSNSYLLMAQQNNASVAPVGEVWREVINQNPTFDLYQTDESHPSIYGSYLAACVFHSTFFQRKVRPSNAVIPGISAADKLIIEQISNRIVFDSLQTWYSNGNIPFLSFSHQQHLDTIQIIDKSINVSAYNWTFFTGNGSYTSTLQNPFVLDPTLLGDSIFAILNASTGCKSDSLLDTIYVLPNSIAEIGRPQSIRVYFDSKSQELKVINATFSQECFIEIYSVDGKLLLKEVASQKLKVNLKKGIYLARVKDAIANYECSSKFTVD